MTAIIVLALAAGPAAAGRLDLDVYSSTPVPVRPEPRIYEHGRLEWKPGDDRVISREPRWVQYTARAGYAGLGLAGLVTSIASGGVAPAVGFGIVSLVQLYGLLKMRKSSSEPAWKSRTEDETN